MTDELNREEEALLQSALSTAFEPTAVPRVSAGASSTESSTPTPPSAASPAAPLAPTEPSVSSTSTATDDWKEEYESHVAKWRAESAEQRTKAEESRKKWEDIRKQEEKEGKWETVDVNLGGSVSGRSLKSEKEPSVAGARDLVSGEDEGGQAKEYLETVPPPGQSSSTVSTPPESSSQDHDKFNSEAESSKHEKWEDVPSSLTSSYPSMSFPSDPHSPSSSHHPLLHPSHPSHPHSHHHSHPHDDHRHDDRSHPSGPTFSVFDSTLSTKTRTLALFSSLSINLLLPFVNGVMLGFGEIFARNVVVGWFGWKAPKAPGSVATNVGLGMKRRQTKD